MTNGQNPIPVTVNLANDLPGLIHAATVNLEDNWKSPDDGSPRQLPIVLGHAQATLALAIAQHKASREAETANLIAMLEHVGQDRDAREHLQARIEERLGLS